MDSSSSSSSSGVKCSVRYMTSFTTCTGRSTDSLITSSVSLTTCGRVGRNRSSDPPRDARLKLVMPFVILHDLDRERTVGLRAVRLLGVGEDGLPGKGRL